MHPLTSTRNTPCNTTPHTNTPCKHPYKHPMQHPVQTPHATPPPPTLHPHANQTPPKVITGVVDNAMAEFADVATEIGLQQQLADLEALALQRGRALGAAGGGDGARWGGGRGWGGTTALACARALLYARFCGFGLI